MVRIVHNLTLRPLKVVRPLIPDTIWKLINFPLVISATLNVDHVRGGLCLALQPFAVELQRTVLAAGLHAARRMHAFLCLVRGLQNLNATHLTRKGTHRLVSLSGSVLAPAVYTFMCTCTQRPTATSLCVVCVIVRLRPAAERARPTHHWLAGRRVCLHIHLQHPGVQQGVCLYGSSMLSSCS